MSDAAKPSAPPKPAAKNNGRVGSFLGWAFLISLAIHAVTLPFFGIKARHAEKQEVEKVSVTKKIRVVVPTPPPPTPTPPPPTPPPKSTPPPVKQTNPPPQPKLKLNVVKTTSKSSDSSNETKYVAPPAGNENGNPLGTQASGPPAPASTAIAATPAPTPAITPTPKPACANPNADATVKSSAELDYPDMARQQGAVGTAQVKVTLDAVGNAVDVSIYKSAGNALLDQSALKAAKASTYVPELVNCVKTPGSYIFRADFDGQ
jgi:TonB family protein